MKYYCRILLAVTCLLFFLPFAQAQKDTAVIRVSGNFVQVKATSFLLALEKQSGYHFYFQSQQLDSILVSFTAQNIPLATALGYAFKEGPIFYAIDHDAKRVFISKNEQVKTELPINFFDAAARNGNGQVTDKGGDEDTSFLRKQKGALLENKLYTVGEQQPGSAENTVLLSGYIHDAVTGEPVAGASIRVENGRLAVIANQDGFYTLPVTKGRHILSIQSMGLQGTRRQVMVYGPGKMNIDLQTQTVTLKNVTVTADKINPIKNVQMGIQRVDIKTIKQVPVAFGESDLLRVVLMMPGVKSAGEASTGLNVRGGAADQNLILFNEATIYNPSHFFGMFSAFNPELVKNAELYKSSIPARYGGRLSSVLEINAREGNKKQLAGSAGIGLLTSRLNIEGPLVKDKSSFILGGRSTYANWLFNLLPDQYKNSKASFYDFNLEINHQLNKNNVLYFTGYISNDGFNLNNDTSYQYGNKNISVRWKHNFSENLYSMLSAGHDAYQYDISSARYPLTAYRLKFDVQQSYFRSNFFYNLNAKHSIEFGFNTLYYQLHPGSYLPLGSASLVAPDQVPAEQALETALYMSDKYAINTALSVEGGIRFSMFNYLGPQSVNNYPPGSPKSTATIVSTTNYASGKLINTYAGPEFRIALRYALQHDLSIKAGFNSQRQYIHVLSNTTAMAPTDIWKLSSPNIKPQYGEQYALGLFKNFASNNIETSVEVYYRNIANYLDYKSGAVLVMNHHVETDVVSTKGKAYGVELLLKKVSGKLNGWLSYTYSRTFLRMNDPSQGEIINNGNYYPSSYDKPHDITLVGNYKFSNRFSISFNTTYSTGRPITVPIGKFYFGGAERTLYSDRNAFRIPDYYRADFSLNIEGNHKIHQLTHNSWTIGVYNLTGRKNPYSVYYVSENGLINGYKLSIFGSAIPYINFNIRF